MELSEHSPQSNPCKAQSHKTNSDPFLVPRGDGKNIYQAQQKKKSKHHRPKGNSDRLQHNLESDAVAKANVKWRDRGRQHGYHMGYHIGTTWGTLWPQQGPRNKKLRASAEKSCHSCHSRQTEKTQNSEKAGAAHGRTCGCLSGVTGWFWVAVREFTWAFSRFARHNSSNARSD